MSELDTIYPPDYYAYQIIENRLNTPEGAGSLLRRYMDAREVARLRPYTKLVGGTAPLRILDIGCGDGRQLDMWKKAFDVEVETHGVEMNDKAAKIAEAQGHKVMPKRIEECDLPPDTYDLVYSFHVVEHVEDPMSFMKAIASTLRPTGKLMIITPNVDTREFATFRKRHWGAWHFPRHWNMYDAKTFTALANKAGFEVERVEYMPSGIFWIWTLHSMLFGTSRKLADVLFPPVDVFLRGTPWIWSIMSGFTLLDTLNLKMFGKTACMRIILRKA